MKLRAFVLTCLAVVIGATTLGSPALAATAASSNECRDNSKPLVRGDFKASRSVTVSLCVERIDDTLFAWADVTTTEKSGKPDIVYHFRVTVRLERYDSVIASESCTYTAAINADNISGYIDPPCLVDPKVSTAEGGWSADGTVSYDIIADGKEDLTWDLHGSDTIT
jgi:hypothetical protein